MGKGLILIIRLDLEIKNKEDSYIDAICLRKTIHPFNAGIEIRSRSLVLIFGENSSMI